MKMVRIGLPSAPFAFTYVTLFFSFILSSWRCRWARGEGSSRSTDHDESLLLFSEAAGRGVPAFKVSYQARSLSAVRRRLLPSAPSVEEEGGRQDVPRGDVSVSGSPAGEATPEGSERVGHRGDVVRSAVAASNGSNSPQGETARGQEAGALGAERGEENSAKLAPEGEMKEDGAEMKQDISRENDGEGNSASPIFAKRPPGYAGDGAQEEEEGAAAAKSAGDKPSNTGEPAPPEPSAVEGEEEVDDEEEEEAEEGIDFQLYLPQQLRKVIPGTNIDYYDYVILEERLARGETDDPPDVRGGLLPDAPEKTIPQVTLKNGVFSYCYTVETEDILSRCVDAAQLGEGVYVPMVNMTDFGRHDDHNQGNPSLQEVSLSRAHYAEAISSFPPTWFEAVRQLKKTTRLAVGGIWFGPPDFKKMDAILREHPKVFDGILVDWDSGEGACMNELTTPPPFNSRGQHTVWWKPKEFFMRYYVGGQDKEICKLKDGRPYMLEAFTSFNEREIDVPFGWNMTFPCFGGYEGRCYKAFSSQPDIACSETQRYVFAPYDRASESMKIYLNDTCAGLGKEMPPHDVVLAV